MSRMHGRGDRDRDSQLRRDKDALFSGRPNSRMAPSNSVDRGVADRHMSRGRPADHRGGGGHDSGYGSEGSRGSRQGSSRYADRRQNGITADNATEEDVDYIKTQIRSTKKQTLQSSRNALRMVMEAETTGANTLNQLGSQSEALNRIEHRLDVSQVHADNAVGKAAHLQSLNRSMFRPAFKNPFSSQKRADKRLAKVEADHLAAQQRKDDLRSAQLETRGRTQQNLAGRGELPSRDGYSASSYSQYQFEADEEDHGMEREVASNLDYVSEAAQRLKNMALAQAGEIDRQNDVIARVSNKTDKAGATIGGGLKRLKSIR